MRRRSFVLWSAVCLVASIGCGAIEGLDSFQFVTANDGGGDGGGTVQGEDGASDAQSAIDGAAAPNDDAAGGEDAATGVDSSASDTSIGDSSVQDSSVADTSVADTSVADTSVADTSVADTSVADTSVADTSVADTGSPDAGSRDAGSDATVCTSLTVIQNGGFASPDSHWVLAQSASYVKLPPSSYYCQLTPQSTGVQGQLWWNNVFSFDHFDVTFGFAISSTSTYADGMGFGWVPQATAVGAPGYGGGAYGLPGVGSYGVVIDTYQNTGEPPAPFLTVVTNDSTTLTTGNAVQLAYAPLPSVLGGSVHTMHVVFDTPDVTVSIDGTVVLSKFAIPNYAPFSGHWLFFASTGAFDEHAYVTGGVTMIFPSGSCSP